MEHCPCHLSHSQLPCRHETLCECTRSELRQRFQGNVEVQHCEMRTREHNVIVGQRHWRGGVPEHSLARRNVTVGYVGGPPTGALKR